jgi:hypothetical protein
MKKLILTTVCAMAVTGAAFAQGTIQWVTGGSGFIVQTNSTAYSPLFGGGSASGGAVGNMGTPSVVGSDAFYFTLLTQTYSGSQAAVPSSLASLAGWTQAWNDPTVYATNGTVAGRPAMTPATDNGQSVNWANGTTQSVVVVGWSADLGTSWTTVFNELNNGSFASIPAIAGGQNAFFGLSATGYINPGQVNPGPVIFSSGATGSGLPIYNPSATPDILYLLPVPEPTSLALAGLGGLSLLLFRRQRK